eukprot:930903-Pelagomonas_calceolata.AAC.1
MLIRVGLYAGVGASARELSPAGALKRKERGRCSSTCCRRGPAGGVQLRRDGRLRCGKGRPVLEVGPAFLQAGLQPATISTAARTDIECACYQICNYHGGYEPINSEPPYHDMYICDVCQRMYHWKCMKELGWEGKGYLKLGCCTDGQRQETDAAETWACPAFVGLNNA